MVCILPGGGLQGEPDVSGLSPSGSCTYHSMSVVTPGSAHMPVFVLLSLSEMQW